MEPSKIQDTPECNPPQSQPAGLWALTDWSYFARLLHGDEDLIREIEEELEKDDRQTAAQLLGQ